MRQVSSPLIALLLTCILNFVSTKSLRRQDIILAEGDDYVLQTVDPNKVGKSVVGTSASLVKGSLDYIKESGLQSAGIPTTIDTYNPSYSIYHVSIDDPVQSVNKNQVISNTLSEGVAQGAQTAKGVSLDNTFSGGVGVGQVSETLKGTSIDNTLSGGVAQGAQTAKGKSLDNTFSGGVAQGVALVQ
ncbi:hypothetical protein ABPG74_015662 [Tetrahymena malaccensis]